MTSHFRDHVVNRCDIISPPRKLYTEKVKVEVSRALSQDVNRSNRQCTGRFSKLFGLLYRALSITTAVRSFRLLEESLEPAVHFLLPEFVAHLSLRCRTGVAGLLFELLKFTISSMCQPLKLQKAALENKNKSQKPWQRFMRVSRGHVTLLEDGLLYEMATGSLPTWSTTYCI